MNPLLLAATRILRGSMSTIHSYLEESQSLIQTRFLHQTARSRLAYSDTPFLEQPTSFQTKRLFTSQHQSRYLAHDSAGKVFYHTFKSHEKDFHRNPKLSFPLSLAALTVPLFIQRSAHADESLPKPVNLEGLQALAQGLGVSITSCYSQEALMEACFDEFINLCASGEWDMIDHLPNIPILSLLRNAKGETLLTAAIKNGNCEVVEGLIKRNVAVENQNQQGESPLVLIVKFGMKFLIDDLIVKTNLAAIGRQGGTFIHELIWLGQFPILQKLLLRHGELLEDLFQVEDDLGRSPLSLAAYLGEQEIIHTLINYGVDPNIKNREGLTVTHFACMGKQKQSLEALAEYEKVDWNQRNIKGNTPEDILRNLGEEELLLHLRQMNLEKPKAYHSWELSPKYLSFQGGGAKGIVFVGALKALEERKVLGSVDAVAGASAGAITAVLVALGFTHDKLDEFFGQQDLTTLLEHPVPKTLCEKIKTVAAVVFKGPVNSGEKFRLWINEIIRQKIMEVTGEDIPHPTFGDLRRFKGAEFPFKNLFLVATELTDDHPIKTFSSIDKTCDDLILADAVRCSMSIPGLFEPHQMYERKEGKRVPISGIYYVDGGVLSNLPNCFDRKAFKENRLEQEDETDYWHNPRVWYFSFEEELNPKQFLKNAPNAVTTVKILAGLHYNAESIIRNIEDDSRVIHIDKLGVNTTDFDLSPQKKLDLIASGEKATQNFLSRYAKGMIGRSHFFYDYGKFIQRLHQGKIFLSDPHPDFFGRKEEIESLEQALVPSSEQSTCLITVLVAKSGFGKSELALTFAWNHLESFAMVWEIDLRNPESYRNSYRKLAKALEIIDYNTLPVKDLIKAVTLALETYSQPWLLIFDNAETFPIEELSLPKKGGSILVTTQDSHGWDPEVVMEVAPFTPPEATQLVQDIINQKDDQVNSLVTCLGYVPLPVNYAGHYLAFSPRESAFTLLQLLGDDPQRRIFEVALDKLKESIPEAAEWLQLTAYLSNKNIPVRWLNSYLSDKRSSKYEQFELKNKILRLMKRFALISHHSGDSTYSLHGQLQKILQSQQQDSHLAFKQLIQLYLQFPEIAAYNPVFNETINPFREVLPHTAALLQQAELYHTEAPLESVKLALILTRYYLDTEGDILEANHYLNAAKEWVKDLDHPINGRVTFLSGMIHRKNREFQSALDDFHNAKIIFSSHKREEDYVNLEPRQGKNHPGYQEAISLQYCAETLLDLNRADEADPLFTQAKALYDTLNLAPDLRFDACRITRDQGRILAKRGDFDAAEKNILEAIDEQKIVYGKRFSTTPTVGATYMMLGDIQMALGHLKDANQSYQEALKVNIAVYQTEVHRHVIALHEKRLRALVNNPEEAKALEKKISDLKEELGRRQAKNP